MKTIGLILVAIGLLALAVVPAIAHDADGRAHRHYRSDDDVVVTRLVDRHANWNWNYNKNKNYNHSYSYNSDNDWGLGSVGLNFGIGDDGDARVYFRDNNDLIIRNYESGPRRVRITEEFEMYVDGKRVDLNGDQRKLVTEFYETACEIRHRSIRIGVEGAKIGVRGAKLGIRAATGALKLLITDYSEEEFERDMEREAARIEADAEPLEKMGDEIDQLGSRLERLYDRMEREIPEIREGI